MHDPLLDQRLEHCRQLLKTWQNFHLFLGECAKHDRVFTPQEEANFLKVKSQIAILYDSFFASLNDPNRETIATAQSIITVVESCILLRQVQRLSTAERKKMEIEWHEAYLLVNATIGTLEEEQLKLASVSPTKHKWDQMIHRAIISVKAVLKDKRLHQGLIAAGILAALVVLPAAGIWNPYKMLQKFPQGKKIYSQVAQALRKSVMKNLEFDEWEDYEKNYPVGTVAPGYGQVGTTQAVLDNRLLPITKVLFQDTPAANPQNLKAVYTAEFAAGNHVLIGFILLPRTTDAISVENRKSSMSGSLPKNVVDRVDVSRVANVVRVLFSDDPGELQKFRDNMPK
jgi:hypothetical protein